MTKKKNFPPKKIVTLREETGTEMLVHPNATMSPTNYDSPTGMDILRRDSTSAPTIGEEDSGKYVDSMAGLADKHFFSKKTIPFSILLIVCGVGSVVIFIQDNSKGLLTDVGAVIWTLKKCAVLCAFILFIWIVISIVTWIKGVFRR